MTSATTEQRSTAWASEPDIQPFRPVRVFYHRNMWSAFCPECEWMLPATSFYRDAAEGAQQHAHRGCLVRAQAFGWRPCSLCHGLGNLPGVFLEREVCRHCGGRGGRPLMR